MWHIWSRPRANWIIVSERNCSLSIDETRLSDLSHFDTVSSISNIPNLNDIYPDSNIPSQVDFTYYIPHQFHSNPELSNTSHKSISFFHCNIRSLTANFDHLNNLLNNLDHPFNIIGLSETWITTQKDPLINLSIPGFISQPTKFRSGGVGFFIDQNLMFHIRDDLGNSTDKDESLWIEIQNNSNNRNIICGVIYRHPNRSLRLFLDDFYKKIDKIHKEGKECVFMGDLNINLLCYDSQPDWRVCQHLVIIFFPATYSRFACDVTREVTGGLPPCWCTSWSVIQVCTTGI